MYNLTPEDLEIQARAASLVDELIPYEEEAEANGGELPPEVDRTLQARALELGLHATNMPAELGGGGYSMLQQVLVQEQGGRATNALGWILGTPPSWFPPVATPEQIEKYVIPGIRAEKEECYAITEEGAGSDVDAIVATARRDGDDYVLDGVKWHVTSYNHSRVRLLPGQADRRGPRRRARHVHRRPAQRRGAGGAHPGLHPHHQPPPPDRRLRVGAGAGHPDGRPGG